MFWAGSLFVDLKQCCIDGQKILKDFYPKIQHIGSITIFKNFQINKESLSSSVDHLQNLHLSIDFQLFYCLEKGQEKMQGLLVKVWNIENHLMSLLYNSIPQGLDSKLYKNECINHCFTYSICKGCYQEAKKYQNFHDLNFFFYTCLNMKFEYRVILSMNDVKALIIKVIFMEYSTKVKLQYHHILISSIICFHKKSTMGSDLKFNTAC